MEERNENDTDPMRTTINRNSTKFEQT